MRKSTIEQSQSISTTEITDACNRYYKLKEELAVYEQTLQDLEDNALFYFGQTDLSDIDAIINRQREIDAAKADINKTLDEIGQTAQIIQKFITKYDIPSGLKLTGIIPYEAEYAIWTDENTGLYIDKTKDLNPEPDDPNTMIIKLSDGSVMKVRIVLTGFEPASSEREVEMSLMEEGVAYIPVDDINED
jgi:hypothetical protein